MPIITEKKTIKRKIQEFDYKIFPDEEKIEVVQRAIEIKPELIYTDGEAVFIHVLSEWFLCQDLDLDVGSRRVKELNTDYLDSLDKLLIMIKK